METAKKNALFRILATFMLLFPIAITIYFMVKYIQIDSKSFGLHIFTSVIMIIFTTIELLLLLKNLKLELAIQHIAFNENKTINKTAFIFVSVAGLIGLSTSTLTGIFYYKKELVQDKMAMMLLFSIFFMLLINTIIFLIYIPIFKEKKLKLEDLIK